MFSFFFGFLSFELTAPRALENDIYLFEEEEDKQKDRRDAQDDKQEDSFDFDSDDERMNEFIVDSGGNLFALFHSGGKTYSNRIPFPVRLRDQ